MHARQIRVTSRRCLSDSRQLLQRGDATRVPCPVKMDDFRKQDNYDDGVGLCGRTYSFTA